MTRGHRLWVGVLAIALVLGSQGTVGSASEKGSPLLSKEFRAAATEAFVRLEILRSAACTSAGNAFSQANSQVGKAMDKAENQAKLEPDRALMKNLYGYSMLLAATQIIAIQNSLGPHADADLDVIKGVLQEISLQKQYGQLVANEAQAEKQVLNQGVQARTPSFAQQQASQIETLRKNAKEQEDSITEQLDALHAQYDAQQQLLGVATDEVPLKQKLLDQDMCSQKVVDQAEDRPRLMKALGLDEAAAARLVEKLPDPIAREALDQWAALVDTSTGMFKRAVAVAKKLELWYEINPDNPDAQALQAEWCGNQEALNQKIHELATFWKVRGTTLEAALSRPGLDTEESLLALRDPMKEMAGLVTALMSERRRLEGMGCSCN